MSDEIRKADAVVEQDSHGNRAVAVNKAILDRVHGLFAYARNVTGAKKVFSIFAAKPVQGDADEAWSFFAEGDCKIQGTLDIVGEITKDGQTLAPVVLQSTIVLTSAQIKTLKSTPVNLVEAPGAGKIIVPTAVIFKYHFGTVPFSGVASQNNLQVIAASNNQPGWTNLTAQGLLDASVDTVSYPTIFLNPANSPRSDLDNLPIQLISYEASEYTLGDGTLSVTVLYSVVEW